MNAPAPPHTSHAPAPTSPSSSARRRFAMLAGGPALRVYINTGACGYWYMGIASANVTSTVCPFPRHHPRMLCRTASFMTRYPTPTPRVD